MTTDQVKTKKTPAGDFLLRHESPIVCFEGGVVTPPATTVTATMDLVAYPVKGSPSAGYTMCTSAEVTAGTVTGFIISSRKEEIVASTALEGLVTILARGPAAVNKDLFPTADIAEDAFVAADMISAAEALGIVVRQGPESYTEM